MYDTIGFYLQQSEAYKCLHLLSNQRENIKNETGEIICTGTLENLRLKINGEHLSISGSIPKYLFGNNLESLTRKDTQTAIEKLSDILHLPIKDSKVFRLDLGANILVKEPLQNYYSCLGFLPRFSRDQFGNNKTLSYKTTQKILVFYDKLKEARKSKVKIPEFYQDHPLLRYELRFLKRVSESLKVSEIKAEDLYKESSYIKTIDLWKQYYFSIPKINSIKLTNEALTMVNVKDFEKQLALIGLKTIGEQEIFQLLENSKSEIDKMTFSRLKKKVTELLKQPELTEPNEAIKELDSKVNQTVRNYR